MAPRSKSIAEHKAAGTYRKDRHGNRAEAAFKQGRPEMPPNCPRPDVWEAILDSVPEHAQSPVDALPLMQLCRVQEMLDRAFSEDDTKAFCQLVSRFISLLERFGCTPKSRPTIKAPPKDEPGDGLALLLSMREERHRRDKEGERGSR